MSTSAWTWPWPWSCRVSIASTTTGLPQLRDLMAEVDPVQAVREMVDSVIVHLYLIVAPAPRLSGASLLESLDDCEVDPFQVLSLARQRHHQSVDVMEVRQRAMGSPWDGEARALRCLPIHPYDKIHH